MGNTVLKSVSKQKAALLQQCGFFYILYVPILGDEHFSNNSLHFEASHCDA
jgi:cytochrome c oxidase assembly factor CtaG